MRRRWSCAIISSVSRVVQPVLVKAECAWNAALRRSSPVMVSATVPTLTTSAEIKIGVIRTTSAITHLITRAEKHGACGSYAQYTWPLFVHSVHHLMRRQRRGLLLRLFGDDRLGGEHQPGNRDRVLQRRPRPLSGSITPALKRPSKISLSALKPKSGSGRRP